VVGSVRPGSLSGVSAVSSGGPARPGNRTGGALRRLAGSVAGRIAREFDLLEDEARQGDRPPGYREGEDLYDLAGVTRDLANDLAAGPRDQGLLARSLGGFVQESAVLLAARPGAASLDAIARAIIAHEGARDDENLARSLAQIDQTTRSIAEEVPAPGVVRPR
jgi:hypothetical protein